MIDTVGKFSYNISEFAHLILLQSFQSVRAAVEAHSQATKMRKDEERPAQ
jgi:hypothetical protein